MCELDKALRWGPGINAMYSYWFDRSGQYQNQKQLDQKSSLENARADRLCCRFCGNPVTSRLAAIEVDGCHEHRKINPQQQKFIIQCFRSATGCQLSGTATLEDTWFGGYTWRFAHCDNCGSQLGWFYQGATHFFALIAGLVLPCKSH
jgi:hypothetical protein